MDEERLNELMAKGQRGQFTSAEREELARALVAPILPPFTDGPADFVSKNTFCQRDLVSHLRTFTWFSRCGEPLSLDLSMPIVPVSGWPEAMEWCTDGFWENVELEAKNQLTVWLHEHDNQNYQQWNERVDRFKASILNLLTEQAWEPYRQRHDLDVVVVHSVQWDILCALMENAYLGNGHRCFFFLELLSVYEAGHFPKSASERAPGTRLGPLACASGL
jgi:hypothetical protein